MIRRTFYERTGSVDYGLVDKVLEPPPRNRLQRASMFMPECERLPAIL